MIKSSAIIFADVNFNLLDGSSVWLQSMSQILSNIFSNKIYLILKHEVKNDLLITDLSNIKKIEIVDPSATNYLDFEFCESLSPAGLKNICANISKNVLISDIYIRGNRYSEAICNSEKFKNKVSEYFAAIPLSTNEFNFKSLSERIGKLKYVIVQTESARSNLETNIGDSNGKIIVCPPGIPDSAFDHSRARKENYLFYSGKFDSNYHTEEYTQLSKFECIQKVIFAGNKFNKDKNDVAFVKRMESLLDNSKGVEWIKGISREKTLETAAKARFGLCWRKNHFDSNEEISTKMLEYMAVGTPPLLNKNHTSTSLLGSDYPYFVHDKQSIEECVRKSYNDEEKYRHVRRLCIETAREYSFKNISKKLYNKYKTKHLMCRKNILFAGHDFKFLSGVIKDFMTNTDCNVHIDTWTSTSKHVESKSKKLLASTDTIFVEWCVGAAVWYSNNKKQNQKLLVRLHRFEIETPWPSKLNIDNVDQVIVVSDWFKRYCIEKYNWPSEKIKIIPQYIDFDYFDRPKHDESEFNIGLVGIVPFDHKRFDIAIELLEKLKMKEERFTLHIRSRMPWEFDYVWSSSSQREKYQNTFKKINTSRIRNSVIFDKPGMDMGSWFRKVGFIISTSDYEGCHTSVAEGMGSGSYPIVFNWNGAVDVYGEKYVVHSIDEAVDVILSNIKSDRVPVKEKASTFDIKHTIIAYREML